jgi:hypothetical protein
MDNYESSNSNSESTLNLSNVSHDANFGYYPGEMNKFIYDYSEVFSSAITKGEFYKI